MRNETTAAIVALATSEAARLCVGALEYLVAGRPAFVKGKRAIVAWSPEKRAQSKNLQLSAFEPGMVVDSKVCPLIDVRAECAFDGASEEAVIAEGIALYCATGRAEVERLFTT